jgi:hypothetical protein
MYTGHGAAPDAVSGAAVFDTANGFAGVWHLGEDPADATANSADGINYGSMETESLIGRGRSFNGIDNYIEISGLMGRPQNLTLSAWVNLDATLDSAQDILSLGDHVNLRADQLKEDIGVVSYVCCVDAAPVWYQYPTGRYVAGTGWRHLAFTFDFAAGRQTLYIDGQVRAAFSQMYGIVYDGWGSNTYIGRHGGGDTEWFTNGDIDEARVSRAARSEAWIKLSYENQKPGSTCVKIWE